MANALAGTAYAIKDIEGFKIIKGVTVRTLSNALGIVDLGFNLNDIHKNGLNWENGTNTIVNIIGFVPGVGWAIAGGYFIIDGILQSTTGNGAGYYLGGFIMSPGPPIDPNAPAINNPNIYIYEYN
jgi:hypothetical protein